MWSRTYRNSYDLFQTQKYEKGYIAVCLNPLWTKSLFVYLCTECLLLKNCLKSTWENDIPQAHHIIMQIWIFIMKKKKNSCSHHALCLCCHVCGSWQIQGRKMAASVKGQWIWLLSQRRRYSLGPIPPANYSLLTLPAASPPTGSCPSWRPVTKFDKNRKSL